MSFNVAISYVKLILDIMLVHAVTTMMIVQVTGDFDVYHRLEFLREAEGTAVLAASNTFPLT